MSEAKHTIGPWSWEGNSIESDCPDAPDYGCVMEVSVSCATHCYGGMPAIEISDANKNLIIAAPDLLEALEAMAEHEEWLQDSQLVRLARAAIAKAKGNAA